MAELPTPISEVDSGEFASYPRPTRLPPLADRLEALVKAYYGMSLAFLTTFAFTGFVIALIGLRSYRISDVFPQSYIDVVLEVALCLVPVLAGCLSWFPIRWLVRGAGWPSWTVVALPIAVALYIAVSPFLFIYAFGPSVDGLVAVIEMILIAMAAFPILRLLIVWQIRGLGVPTGPWLIRSRMRAEIRRLRTLQDASHPVRLGPPMDTIGA